MNPWISRHPRKIVFRPKIHLKFCSRSRQIHRKRLPRQLLQLFWANFVFHCVWRASKDPTMDTLSNMTSEDLREWLLEKDTPVEVADAFEGQSRLLQKVRSEFIIC